MNEGLKGKALKEMKKVPYVTYEYVRDTAACKMAFHR